MQKPVAHIRELDSGEWLVHPLNNHLRDVGELAAQFAEPFGATDWARLAGLWHDLGKYQQAFQRRIRFASGHDPEAHLEGSVGKLPHSTAGALHAVNRFGPYGRLLAYCIAGHHAGLPDWAPDTVEGSDGGKSCLQVRLAAATEELKESLLGLGTHAPDWLQSPQPEPKLPGGAAGLALWQRMLFSCLVDADFLNTESFMDPTRTTQRAQTRASVMDLEKALRSHLDSFTLKATPSGVTNLRSEVLSSCRSAAELKPGLFSLTVPTGGGKTLSSLAFALTHAVKWQKRRVVYAIPFTSIIEQTADVFRNVFRTWPDAVLEHHSNLDPARETPQNRLWAENWDAPLTVTTNVQLFESLFAAKPSRCRKLHNLVNSVIVLDEAQQLPREFLDPIVHVVELLTWHYGVTVLLCTATQPALEEKRDAFGHLVRRGLTHVREIAEAPMALAGRLKRVSVQPLKDWRITSTWQEVADYLLAQSCVLVIVNRRADCRTLYNLLPAESGRVHVSALMCGQHRTDVIANIKERLSKRRAGDSQPLRVVATQLVEAGVDFDFPVVVRAMAGLDSIAQAAGRCNREGLLDTLGTVTVFNPEAPAPPGLLRQGEDTARELLLSGEVTDPLAPESFRRYFDRLYSKGELDKHAILTLEQRDASRGEIPFRTIAKRFKLIADDGVPIVVPYNPPNEAESPVFEWLSRLEREGTDRAAYRALQRYTVSVPEHLLQAMQQVGDVEVREGLYLARRYDAEIGLVLPTSEIRPSELLA